MFSSWGKAFRLVVMLSLPLADDDPAAVDPNLVAIDGSTTGALEG